MSTFGKILAFFNVFVATVFLVVAGMDYGRQQSWTYSEFRHHLLLTGLPVNNEEIDEQNPQSDDYLVDRLSKGVLDDVFQGNDGERNDLGGESVKTLFEEVDRVRVKLHKSIEDELAAADALAEPQKQQAMAKLRFRFKQYLLALAKTYGDREKLRQIVDGEDGIKKALVELDNYFYEAKEKADKGPSNKKDMRAKIAHVLVNVSATDAWRKRVMVVVGMEAYIDALNRQADNFAKMVTTVQTSIASDQAAFERHHADLVQLILNNSDELHKANVALAKLQAEFAERGQQVELRKTEKGNYETRLTQARGESTQELKKLNAIQKDLYALQQRLVLSMQRNQDLAGELQTLEQGGKR